MSKDFLAKIQAQRAQQANGQTGAAVAPTAPTVFDLMAEVTGGKLSPARAALIEQALVADGDTLRFDDVQLTAKGLVIPPDGLSEDTSKRLFSILLRLEGSIQWLLGDLLADSSNRKWGETYREMAAAVNVRYESLMDYAWVARAVQFSVRTEKLSFNHHKLVAGFDVDKQALWLGYAERLNWSHSVMKAYSKLMKNWSADDQRDWLEVVERDKLTPEQLREAIAEAAGVNKPAKPTATVKQQLTYAAYLSNVVKRFGVELDGVETDTIKHAVKAAREVMAMAQAILDKHGGKS